MIRENKTIGTLVEGLELRCCGEVTGITLVSSRYRVFKLSVKSTLAEEIVKELTYKTVSGGGGGVGKGDGLTYRNKPIQ